MTRASLRGWGGVPAALVLVGLLLAGAPGRANAQLRLTNLLEPRIGGNPFRTDLPDNRNEVYDRLDLEGDFGDLSLGLRFETYHSGFETTAEPGYDEVTQRWADWSDAGVRVRVGNFYTILGRGLLHRSFELPGVVLDQILYPSRYTPSRDVDGVLAEANIGPLAARAFQGRPSTGEYAPGADELSPDFGRRGLVSGAQGTADLWRGSQVGIAYTRLSSEAGGQQEYGSVFAALDPMQMAGIDAVQAPLYLEVARKDRWSEMRGFTVGDGDTAAVYAGANLIWRSLAFSAEWKDYRAFRLGTNDPPTLSRENSYYLLNRSTHFLDANLEQGFQIEGSWAAPAWVTVTANLSRSDGDFDKRFEERYGEVHLTPPDGGAWDATVFLQDGQDEFVTASITDRTIAGAVATVPLWGGLAASFDVEGLEATRVDFFGRPVASFDDRYIAVGVTRADRGGITVIWERTTDPVAEAPEDQASAGVQANTFFAAIVNARIGERHEATLFAGQRRGGPACTAGTCYVVEPFEGVELRLTSRF